MRKPKKNDKVYVPPRRDMNWDESDEASGTYTWNGKHWTRNAETTIEINYNNAQFAVDQITEAAMQYDEGMNSGIEIDTFETSWGGTTHVFKVSGQRDATEMEIVRIDKARAERQAVMEQASATQAAMEAEEVQAFIKALLSLTSVRRRDILET